MFGGSYVDSAIDNPKSVDRVGLLFTAATAPAQQMHRTQPPNNMK